MWKLNISKDAVDDPAVLSWRTFLKLTTINGIHLSVNA